MASGVGTLQASLPAPQNVIVALSGQSTQTFGPFEKDVTVSVRGGPLSYGVVSDAESSSAATARLSLLTDTSELQALALANKLDARTTYIDLASGNRYWATTPNTYISAGGALDASALNYVESGLLPPASGAIASAVLTSGVAYVEGNRVAITATPLALTATRDNYIDLRRDGTVIVTSVVVSATAPAIPANSMRLGFVTTNASNVTARSISAFDNIGNWMYNATPAPACRARSTTLQGFGGAAIALAFPEADTFDNASIHNPALNNERFTLPSNGLYQIDAGVVFSAPLTPLSACTLEARLDGTSDPSFPQGYLGPQAHNALRCSGQVVGRAGQYVDLLFTPNGVSSAIAAAWMNIAKIGG